MCTLHLQLAPGAAPAPSCWCSCAPSRGPAELADIGGGGRGCALREAAGQKWSTQSLRPAISQPAALEAITEFQGLGHQHLCPQNSGGSCTVEL